MGIIKLEGMQFYAYHGHFEVEQITGNQFTVDLTIETDFTHAAETDSIKGTINYQDIYDLVKKEMQQKSRLLENVAYRILNALHENFPGINKSEIKLTKLNPPMGGKIDNASIILNR